LVYLGLQDAKKSLLIAAKAAWETNLNDICGAIPKGSDDQDKVTRLSGVDATKLAGVYLLQLTTNEQDIATLSGQYNKYAEGVEKINQAWKSYLEKKGVQPDDQAKQENVGGEVAEEESNKITEANKVAAVRRVQEPLNKPEWIANPLHKLKEFDAKMTERKNQRLFFEHRNDLLGKVLRFVFAALVSLIGYPAWREKSKHENPYSFLRPYSKRVSLDTKQVFLDTQDEARPIKPQSPAPRAH
jgi:hypothetical protein